ncbi:MAG: PilZ domain-containing protein [Bdellovibrionales bacterium]
MKDARLRSRRAFCEDDSIAVQFNSKGITYSGFVCDLSIGGMGVTLNCDMPKNFSIGDHIAVDVEPSGVHSINVAAEIVFLKEEDFGIRLGLKYTNDDREKSEIRRTTRYPIPVHLRPSASFMHPFSFNDTVWMKVRTFSRFGMDCILSSRNDHLIPGQQVRVQITLPILGSIFVACTIRYAHPNRLNRDEIFAGFVFEELSEDASGKICEFIVMVNQKVSYEILREEGFTTVYTSSAVDFDIARDEVDLKKVCQLRLKALKSQGYFQDETDCNKMLDEYDRYSKICTVRIGKKIVGTARLVYNQGNKYRSEHYSEYGIDIPEWLWQEGFVEASRVATDPEYRSGDLFTNITQWLGRQTMLSGYRYMLSSCTEKLAPIYIKSGCKKIGEFQTDDGGMWHLLLLDVPAVSKTKNIDPITWNVLYRPTVEYVMKRDKLKYNLWDRFRILVFKSFGSISEKLYRKTLIRRSKGNKKRG